MAPRAGSTPPSTRFWVPSNDWPHECGEAMDGVIRSMSPSVQEMKRKLTVERLGALVDRLESVDLESTEAFGDDEHEWLLRLVGGWVDLLAHHPIDRQGRCRSCRGCRGGWRSCIPELPEDPRAESTTPASSTSRDRLIWCGGRSSLKGPELHRRPGQETGPLATLTGRRAARAAGQRLRTRPHRVPGRGRWDVDAVAVVAGLLHRSLPSGGRCECAPPARTSGATFHFRRGRCPTGKLTVGPTGPRW